MQTLLGQHLSILRCMHVYKTYQENDGRHRSMTSLVNHGKYFRHVTIASWHKHQPMDTADSQWAKCTTWWRLINCKVQILHWSILPFFPCQQPPQHLNFWSVQMLDKHFFPSIPCTGHKAAYRCYCLLEWNFFTVALTCSIHLQKLKKKRIFDLPRTTERQSIHTTKGGACNKDWNQPSNRSHLLLSNNLHIEPICYLTQSNIL